MRANDTGLSVLAASHASHALAVDPAGLHELRRQAEKNTDEGLDGAARAFESLLVGQMLKQMRSASPGDGLFESEQSDLYREMYDQEIARMISDGEGLGIRDMMMRQLGGSAQQYKQAVDPATLPVPERNSWLRPIHPLVDFSASHPIVDLAASKSKTSDTSFSPSAQSTLAKPFNAGDWPPATPEEFLSVLKPQAEAAAAEIGVDPLVLLAQCALETGWGKRTPHHANGDNSYNLFGIKAHGGWTGDRVSVGTLEYRNGVARREQAQFRSYASPAESFLDYVEFLRRNPRYSNALASDNSGDFVRGLQRAGYATDPNYANKILSIHNRLRSMMAKTEDQESASEAVTTKRG